MSSQLFAHARDKHRNKVPSITVTEHDDYVSINFVQGDNQVAFFVHAKESESMDALITRVARELCPKFELKQTV